MEAEPPKALVNSHVLCIDLIEDLLTNPPVDVLTFRYSVDR